MNLAGLKADTYRRLRMTTAPPTAIETRITAFLNEVQHEVLGMPGLEKLRDDTIAITTVADQSRLGLPSAVGRIQGIVDRANNQRLIQLPLSELRTIDPSRSFSSGAPQFYSVLGESHVQRQPSNASAIYAVSSVAGDTGQVYLEGIRSNGSLAALSATMAGTTAVTIGVTETTLVELTKFYLGTAAVGTVTAVEDTSGGTQLALIGIGQTYGRFLTVEWFPIPTTAAPLFMDYTRQILELINANDEPLVPPDFHYVLSLGARMKEYELLDDTRVMLARSEYERGKSALRSWVLGNPDRIASLRPTYPTRNQLGPQFPAN